MRKNSKAIAGSIVAGLASIVSAAPTAGPWSILVGAIVAAATYAGVYAAPKNET